MAKDLIPRRVIELASKGGWHAGARHMVAQHVFSQALYAFDRLFWQALGKALRWADYPLAGCWYDYARQFCALVLTGGDLDAFWEEILPANKGQ